MAKILKMSRQTVLSTIKKEDINIIYGTKEVNVINLTFKSIVKSRLFPSGQRCPKLQIAVNFVYI